MKKATTPTIQCRSNSNAGSTSRLYIVGYAGVIILAGVLAFLYVGDKSLWLDEAISVGITRVNWTDFAALVMHGEANMALYYTLLRLWVYGGDSEIIIRSLSILFAVGTIPVVIEIGRRLFDKWTGLLAGFLLAIGPFFVEYAQEARSYSMVLFLVSLSTLLFINSLQNPDSRWRRIVYILISALAVYAHVFATVIILIHCLSLFFTRNKPVSLSKVILTYGIIGILILPIALSIFLNSMSNLDYLTKPSLIDLARAISSLAGGKYLLALFGILCLVSLVYLVKNLRKTGYTPDFWASVFLGAWFLFPITGVFCVSQIKPMFVDKYFIFCMPPLVLLTAMGILKFKKLAIIPIILIITLFSAMGVHEWYFDYKDGNGYKNEDWSGATAYIIESAESGDAIVFYSPDTNTGFRYYQERYSKMHNVPEMVLYYDPNKYPFWDPVMYVPEGFAQGGYLPDPDQELIRRLSEYQRVWLVLSHDKGINDRLNREAQSFALNMLLQDEFDTPENSEFHGIRVLLYSSENSRLVSQHDA